MGATDVKGSDGPGVSALKLRDPRRQKVRPFKIQCVSILPE